MVDIIAAELPRVAAPGEVVYVPKGIVTRVGGHPANVAVDLVKLGFAPSRVVVAGCVGNDIYGRLILDYLSSHGVRAVADRISGVETGKNLILVVKGEDRRFHEDLGANQYLSGGFASRVVERERPGLVFIGGVGVLGGLDHELPAVVKNRTDGRALTYTDFMHPYNKDWRSVSLALKWSDIAHFNRVEAEKLVGGANPEESCVKAVKKGVKLSILTMGSEGLVAASREWLIRLGRFKVKSVDPTGAGDAFSAGLIYKLCELGLRLEAMGPEEAMDALVFASAVGASATLGEGATSTVDRETVLGLLESQGDSLKSNAMVKRLDL